MNGREQLEEWRQREGLSLRALGQEIGDRGGYQTGRYLRNADAQLSMRLARRISDVAGIPLRALLTSAQWRAVEQTLVLVARDGDS